MRVRFWVLVTAALLALGLASCAPRVARVPNNTPLPTKTLRPTFTATVPKPTLTPSPAPGQGDAAAASDQQAGTAAEATVPATATANAATAPTVAPSPTPEAAAFTVNSGSVNVRGGPGTTFPVLGRLTGGQTFPLTGKSADGSWWQFGYNGKQGWVVASNVTVTGGASVQVAKNIPSPPTAAPRPTARPVAAQPAAPKPAQPAPAPQPAPATGKYTAIGTERRPDTNDWVTVYCLLLNQAGTGLLPGNVRVTRDGQVVGSAAFTQFATFYLEVGYNAGCKVEIRPAVNGNYTAVLVEGDQVVSDPISFSVTGDGDRITVAKWKQR